MGDARKIGAALAKLSCEDAQYWEFRRQAQRDGLHALLQYPAMMVPRMQGDVLDTLLGADPSIQSIWDPFVGAGTTLTEAMLRGCDFLGHDINPLAVLTCEAKSGVFRSDQLERKVKSLLARIDADHSSKLDVNFPGRDKWFSQSASRSISRVRRAIIREKAKWARKIMWVVLSEAIRRTSNSRTSTYKLHVRPESERALSGLPEDIFTVEIRLAVQRFRFHQSKLEEKGLLEDGRYVRSVFLKCVDTKSHREKGMCDLVFTSPPYGDNRSTVPYGQFSYLSLNWIPREDLPGDPEIFATTQATDHRSLGGSIKGFEEKAAEVMTFSATFRSFYKSLCRLERKSLQAKVASFIFDFDKSLETICSRIKPGGKAVWTLGNRTVGGLPVPLSEICREIQERHGLQHVTTLRRRIPYKRVPNRNAIGSTMGAEVLLVMKKASST